MRVRARLCNPGCGWRNKHLSQYCPLKKWPELHVWGNEKNENGFMDKASMRGGSGRSKLLRRTKGAEATQAEAGGRQ